MQIAKKNNNATIGDLRGINKIIEKVRRKENTVMYGRLGKKEDLQVIGMVDTSYKTDEKLIKGMILMIANKEMTRASPIM